MAAGAAPKTLNRRIASLSSFFKYLQAAAAELRLPIPARKPGRCRPAIPSSRPATGRF